jgi:hypothetical protein
LESLVMRVEPEVESVGAETEQPATAAAIRRPQAMKRARETVRES